MKFRFNGKYHLFLTQIVHFILLDYLWKILEIMILGEVRRDLPNSIMLALICAYIAWILDEEDLK